MVDNSELPRIPGIHDSSTFFRTFDSEEVVVRPADLGRGGFKIDVLLSDGKAFFPPEAPVHENDVVERVDPRGGVMQYTIARYTYMRDPFGDGSHWEASLTEDGHRERTFGASNIVINGGVNQFAVGEGNDLKQVNNGPSFPEVLDALETVGRDMPRSQIASDQIEELEDALEAAGQVARDGDAEKPRVMKRALRSVQGVIAEIRDAALGGTNDAVKTWATAASAVLLAQLTGM